MFSRDRGGEDHADPAAPARCAGAAPPGRRRPARTPSKLTVPGQRIVEAQQQMKDRALAGAGRTDDRDLLARPHAEADVVEHRSVLPRRIMEIAPPSKATSPRAGVGSATGCAGTVIGGLHRQDLEQPLGGAGSLRDLAPTWLSSPSAPAAKHRIEHELSEPARRDPPAQDVLRADPQHQHDAGENQENNESGQQRPRTGRLHARRGSALDRGAETRAHAAFVGEGLQDAHGTDHFRGIGRGIRKRILRGARAAAHRAAEADQRQHDDRNRAEHESRTAAGSSPPSSRRRRRTARCCASAIETDAPTADLICVVSAVRREIISPVCAWSKKAGDSAVRCANTSRAQIGDDAFAERRDEVEAQRACAARAPPQRAIMTSEIAVDQRERPRPRSRNRSSAAPRPARPTWRSAATISATSAAKARPR